MKSVKVAYREFLNTRRGTDAYRDFKRIVYSTEDSLVRTLNTRIARLAPAGHRQAVSICDIGGGDGDRITRIIRFLHEKSGVRLKLDFIEQSDVFVGEFAKRLPLNVCETRVLHGLFEEVPLSQGHYDLVLLIHSIFALENGGAVDKVLSLRNAGGKIVVVANEPDSFLSGLKGIVDEGFDDKRYEVDEFQKALDKRGVRYAVLPFETRWTIERGRWERDVMLIIDWISLGRFRRFTAEKKRKTFSYITERTVTEKNRVVFTEKENLLCILDDERAVRPCPRPNRR